MKVHYDKEVDAAYIRFSSKRPQGAIEIDEGVIFDVSAEHQIVALEVLDASQRFPIRNLFTLELAE